MYRATTPTHVFIFEDNPQDFTEILITYAQKNIKVLEKTKGDLTVETYTPSNESPAQYVASLKLSQAETKLFHTYHSPIVCVQVRALDATGNVYASKKVEFLLEDVLDDRELRN